MSAGRAPCCSDLALAALAALVLSTPLPAESLYVIEQLVVAVASAPDASGERVATLHSGDRVEVLERAGEQVHVRLAGGREGWVRASYLSAEEPLRVRLAQREAEVARLGDEVNALKSQLRPNGNAASTSDAAVVSVSASGGAPSAAAKEEEAGNVPAAGLFNTPEERPHVLWPWTLATGLVGFGIGFGLGALMLDRHIRRKYGGLRIY
ncbi:MAG: SH3 domain-containing protein [Gammaproteobacteria bacterium]|nr:SH3 domain-containing protein [Gammaproteobacteria bacterium]